MDIPPSHGAEASGEMTCEPLDTNVAQIKEPDLPLKDVLAPGDVDKNNNIEKEDVNENIIVSDTNKAMNSKSGDDCSDCESGSSSTSNLESKRKELLTSFSRRTQLTSGRSCNHQNHEIQQMNSKFGDFTDRSSTINEPDISKRFNLANFIVAGIGSNLKSLGVEELDCKEYVEAWLSQRRQRRWKQSLAHQALNLYRKSGADSYSCTQCSQNLVTRRTSSDTEASASVDPDKSETLTVFSPSQPNSSLLRLTGDGNVKLGQFLQRMEEVRGHLNNATCTFLQISSVITLPYLKLRSGNQLEDACCINFTEEWVKIVSMMAQDLKIQSSKEVDMMLCREHRSLRAESKKLYKRLRKLYKKIYKMFEENERDAKPALQRLQPKSLPKFRGRRAPDKSNAPGKSTDGNNNKNKEKVNTTLVEKQPTPVPSKVLELTPIPLTRANMTMVDLYKNHIFFSKSRKGYLVYKNDIDEDWKRFSTLSFNNRRELFLHVVDDLHWTLKLGASIAGHVKELFIEGYPESVATKIHENLKYLKEVSKQEDLLMLSKVTIANQVKSLHDSLTRLVKTLENAKTISKCFCKSIKQSPYVLFGSKSIFKRNKNTSQPNSTQSSSSTSNKWEDFDVNLALRFDDSKIKLLVPYTNSPNHFIDQFYTSFAE